MKNKFIKKLLLICVLMGMLILPLAACTNNNNNIGEEKQVYLTVIHKDKSVKEFEAKSNAEFLGDAFIEQHIYYGEMGAYGMFIQTVDEEFADEKNEEWWNLTKDGESVNTGIDKTPFANGDKFQLVFTTGY